MIGYLEGQIRHFETDSILLLVGDIGYDVLLNPRMMESVRAKETSGEPIGFYIYYHQTERQPKPVLIGFETLEDKAFFQTFITVDAIGPMKAAKAMTCTTGEIAMAIEKKDAKFLTGLAGIGKRTAEKIIATLHGKVERFVSKETLPTTDSNDLPTKANEDIAEQVIQVLVEQLGHSQSSARRMINEAFDRNPDISTPEALFDEIYQEVR